MEVGLATQRRRARKSSKRRAFFLAPWADRIDITRTSSDLVVLGFEPWMSEIANEQDADWERDLLRSFDVGRRLPRNESRLALHLQFASAKEPEQQVDFVARFGPVLANEFRCDYEPFRLTASQNLAILGLEQKLYSAFLELIQNLKPLTEWSRAAPQAVAQYNEHYSSIANGALPLAEKTRLLKMQSDFEDYLLKFGPFRRNLLSNIERIRDVLVTIQGIFDAYPDAKWSLGDMPVPFSWKDAVGLGSLLSKARLSSDLGIAVVHLANLLLCRTFDQFPLHLSHTDGFTQELPEFPPYGIRPILYYMLRSEYLSQRELRLCSRPNCGWYFVPDRVNAVFCSDLCQNSEKQRRLRERAKLKKH
jgi:hypothetical protein